MDDCADGKVPPYLATADIYLLRIAAAEANRENDTENSSRASQRY
jgi:hypothetical protein